MLWRKVRLGLKMKPVDILCDICKVKFAEGEVEEYYDYFEMLSHKDLCEDCIDELAQEEFFKLKGEEDEV